MNRKLPIKKKVITMPQRGIVYHHRIGKNKVNQVTQPSLRNVSAKQKLTISSKRPIAKPVNRVKRVDAVRVAKKITNKRVLNRNFAPDTSLINSLRGSGKGKILVVIAPGPSILEAEISKLKGMNNIDTLTVNKPDHRLWETDYWMFCDRSQQQRNIKDFEKYKRTIINSASIRDSRKNQIKINTMQGEGFSKDMTKGFFIGRSTTYSAMQVAIWMGYQKIFIFGCDMCRVTVIVNGKKKSLLHSYGRNPDVPEKIRERRFKKEAKFYDSAANIMGEENRDKFYFCSSYNPWPFVDKYNRLDHKTAVEYIINEHKRMDQQSKQKT